MNGKIIQKKVLLYSCILFIFIGNVIGIYASEKAVTILFTHDMHDHLCPQKEIVNGELVEKGGYGKIAYLVNQEKLKDPELLLVDAGDFSMGTVFQTIYSEKAPQLRLMGEMGYDAITFGNHEFDFRDKGLAQMLNQALQSGDKLPTLVASNMQEVPNELQRAMINYGVKPYTVIERSGTKIGIFGLIGKEAASNAPMTEVIFANQVESAKEVVKQLKEENVDLIICLSHSGTNQAKSKSEDEILAKEVPDIDVIISGHTHSTLSEPIRVGDTIIGSVGENGSNLGKIVVKPRGQGGWTLENYTFIPVEGDLPTLQTIEDKISAFAKEVEINYLNQFDFQAGEIIAHSPHHFEENGKIGSEHKEIGLANMITDAYIYATQQAEGEAYIPIDMAVVPSGVIRGSFVKGDITVEHAFNVSSLGIGADGVSGYPLVSAYLTGKELRTVCEVDASITPLMSVAQLYLSGIHYTFNPNRLIFNKVTDAYQVGTNKERIEIEDDKLYRIVGGLYSAQMLSIVGDQSFGILSVVPKDKDGLPITDFETHIIRDGKSGAELKEWVALAQYMQSFEKENGISQIPLKYETIEGRKVIDDNKSMWSRIKSPNTFALIVYSILFIILLILILLIRIMVTKIKKQDTNVSS